MSKPNEIKRIAAAALTSIDGVLNYWCPGGKRQGCEYVTLNPTRSDKKAGSFFINLTSGLWSDFATDDKGGDLVSLVGYIEGVKNGEAAERLAQFLGIATEKTNTNTRATNAQKTAVNTSAPATLNKAPLQSGNGAVNSGDGFMCIMPVPNDAPAPPVSHSRHGKPSKRYAYLTEDGTVNFYHDRFEPKKADERKQFAPLTFWRDASGKSEWRYKAPLARRPLYGLPSLLTFPSTDVWLVEGEKAADALAMLMPECAIVTWQGGAQAVAKADFTNLAERTCIVWPDYDDAGTKAAADVCKSLQAVGAQSVRLVNLKELASATQRAGYIMQPGDDAYDLLQANITAKKLAMLMASDDVMEKAESKQAAPIQQSNESSAKTNVFKRHFQLEDTGVYVVDVTRERDAYQAPKWICDRLEVLAQSRSPTSGEWGKLVKFNDPDNVQHRFIIPARSFNGEGLEATGLLYENGLNIVNKGRALVLEYLQQQKPEKMVRVTNRIGWHGEASEAVFVLPHGAIGNACEEWVFDGLQPNDSHFKQRGTLEGWRDNVASLCVGNSRLVFAVSISFAAPLRYLVDIKDLGGFHYRGDSTDGKSTALLMAASVCGSPDYMQRWRATSNALEGLAMQHCDAPLLLDDLKQVEPKAAGEAAYMLANGSGKVRSNEKGVARKTAKWRLIFLSSGELGLAQHMMEANQRTYAGQEIRMADIPSDAGAGLGCFENLHDHLGAKQFSDHITNKAKQHYGVAFPAFVENVTKDRAAILDKLKLAQQAFDNGLLSETASGQSRRVASIFALVGAAGELATQAGITGWQPGEAFKAAKSCFKAWLEGFGGEGNQEQRAMLSQVRYYLEKFGEGAFADLDRNAIEDNHAARVTMKSGYRKHDAGSLKVEYYVYPEVFRADICKGLDCRKVVKLLVDKGYMHKGDGRNIGKPKRDLPEGHRRVYHIFSTIFDDDED